MRNAATITTDSGDTVEAHAPVIVSASRSTDIPAFYAKWFINRLQAGYAVWYNPFNQKPMYISLKNPKVVVFWTKNPQPLMDLDVLKELDDRGIHYYFQFTLNDYDREGFEPSVPLLKERIETFKALSDKIGKDKVIWRFDPIIITPQHTTRDLLVKIWETGKRLKGYTDKLVFSFIDIQAYRKVQSNLKSFFARTQIEAMELCNFQLIEIAEGLAKIRDHWKSEGWNIALATCAEEIDLKKYDIDRNRCIDGELMKKIFSSDSDLMHYLSYGELPGNKPLLLNELPRKSINLKDKGQRKACGCIISKDIGMYNTCPHFCVYCYANTSKQTVEKFLSSYSDQGESISYKFSNDDGS